VQRRLAEKHTKTGAATIEDDAGDGPQQASSNWPSQWTRMTMALLTAAWYFARLFVFSAASLVGSRFRTTRLSSARRHIASRALCSSFIPRSHAPYYQHGESYAAARADAGALSRDFETAGSRDHVERSMTGSEDGVHPQASIGGVGTQPT
jgi:hypothetical protein